MCSREANAELRDLLHGAVEILRYVGETDWAGKIEEVVPDEGEPFAESLIRKILSWYGGMGSFNDLVIAEINGHEVSVPEEEILNARLEQLRANIYALAIQLLPVVRKK